MEKKSRLSLQLIQPKRTPKPRAATGAIREHYLITKDTKSFLAKAQNWKIEFRQRLVSFTTKKNK